METWTQPTSEDPVQQWVTRVCHLLVSLLLACALVSLVQVGRRLEPGWRGEYLVFYGWMTALEAMASQRFLNTAGKNFSFEGRAGYRAVEWVVLLLGLRLAVYAVQGFDLLLADISMWPKGFLESFFSGEYLLVCLVCFLVWLLATSMSAALATMEDNARGLGHEEAMIVAQERIEARRHLMVMIFGLGTILVILAALLRQDIDLFWKQSPGQRVGVYNVMLYFLIGLVLLSLTRFTLLRARWDGELYQVSRGLSRSWLVYSAAILIALALISAVLPTSYSIGLLDTLKIVFQYLMAFVSLLGFLLSAPIYFLLSLLSRLVGREPPPVQPPELEFNYQPPPDVPAPVGSEMLRSLLFWVIFLAVISLSLLYYLRNHPLSAGLFKKLAGTRWIVALWSWLVKSLKDVGKGLASAVESGVKRILTRQADPVARPLSRLRVRRLSSRQKVLFYYLAMVRRGGESGLPRKPSQTPGEYSAALVQKLQAETPYEDRAGVTGRQEIGGEIGALTAKFMQARYSREEVSTEEAGAVKRIWLRIRSVLRRIHL